MNKRPKLLNRLRRRLRGKRGMTLAETMVALLIISLLSIGVAEGVSFGVRQYNSAMIRSESRILSSTLTSILRDEFLNTKKVKLSNGGVVSSYATTRYRRSGSSGGSSDKLSTLKTDSSGHLALESDGYEFQLLPDAAYSSKLQLKADASVVFQDDTFNVTLTISSPDSSSPGGKKEQIRTTFNVIPLNAVEIVP